LNVGIVGKVRLWEVTVRVIPGQRGRVASGIVFEVQREAIIHVLYVDETALG